MGGGSQGQTADDSSVGYSEYSPGGQPTHPDLANYMQGWEAAKNADNSGSDDNAHMFSMFEEFMGGGHEGESHEGSEYDPTEDYLTNQSTSFADLQEYLSQDANPNAVSEELTEYEGEMYGWNTETNAWEQRDTPGQFLWNEETEAWDSYNAPSGGYGWNNGRWEHSGSDLSDYSRIYTAEGDMYERSTFDDIMGGRSTAANSATEYVNAQITDEGANAALLGVDYSITDDQKSTRINDYFSTLWSQENEDTVTELAQIWGEDLARSGVTRGSGETAGGEGKSTKGGTTKGIKPKSLATTADENTLGGSNTLLGGT